MSDSFKYSVHYNTKKAQFIAKVKQNQGQWVSKFVPKRIQHESEAKAWVAEWCQSLSDSEVTIQKGRKKRGKGTVYCIQLLNSDGYVKVGYTNNLDTRLSHLQTGCPYDFQVLWTQEGTHKEELAFKRLFSSYRVKNEWFFPAALELLVEAANTSS